MIAPSQKACTVPCGSLIISPYFGALTTQLEAIRPPQRVQQPIDQEVLFQYKRDYFDFAVGLIE